MATDVRRGVILLSGGIDSSTVLAIAKAEGHEVYALSFDYHQRHDIELHSARMVASSLGVKKHLIISFDLREIGGSALTANIDVPKSGPQSKSGREKPVPPEGRMSIPVTYVPARNTIFLSFALGWAEVLEAENIFIGANAVDYSGYPDCRPEYLKAFESMANLATKASVTGKLRFVVRAPLMYMKKADIIRKGTSLGLDYALTWSCYDPKLAGEKKAGPAKASDRLAAYKPCGSCDSCIIRKKGFLEAGITDPFTSYR